MHPRFEYRPLHISYPNGYAFPNYPSACLAMMDNPSLLIGVYDNLTHSWLYTLTSYNMEV